MGLQGICTAGKFSLVQIFMELPLEEIVIVLIFVSAPSTWRPH